MWGLGSGWQSLMSLEICDGREWVAAYIGWQSLSAGQKHALLLSQPYLTLPYTVKIFKGTCL